MKTALATTLARLPATGERYVVPFRHGTMRLGLYAPRGNDPQQPHAQDELYVVVSGRGDFVCADARTTFGPGDVLFAAAGAAHRFENFSDDFATWVVFYGAAGGERNESAP
jgi:mannose-6-phosphate isomerase-like protein (cupin superfamily)